MRRIPHSHSVRLQELGKGLSLCECGVCPVGNQELFLDLTQRLQGPNTWAIFLLLLLLLFQSICKDVGLDVEWLTIGPR